MKNLTSLLKTLDPRITIGYEFCGYPEQRIVLRFCGEFINSHLTVKGAMLAALEFDINRLECGKPVGLVLIANTNDVQLYRKNSKHFVVAYGAEVDSFTSMSKALQVFASCMSHSIEGVE